MEKEIENLIEQLTKVRPEMLNEEALKLFNTIMAVLGERDMLKEENENYALNSIKTLKYIDNECIRKSVVREKIKDLEYEEEMLDKGNGSWTHDEIIELYAKLNILRKLLGE